MLTDRQQMILRMIVDDYVRFAEPVGSRTISKHSELSLSPATIRNEMSDLEELGFLEQPHTSAGRIPSQKGYRFYVDYLLPQTQVDAKELQQIKKVLMERIDEMEKVAQQSAQVLSSLTNYTSIILGHQTFETTLKHIQIVPLGERSAVAILVTDTGHVEHRTISIPDGISVEDMTRFVTILNSKLVGAPMHQVKKRLFHEVMQELQAYMDRFEQVMILFDQLVTPETEEKVYLGGTAKILNQPEFRDIDKLGPLLDVLETQQAVARLLHTDAPGIRVRIGLENDNEQVKDCSIVTATYSLDGKTVGTIGVLGPTRMDYGRVIGILGYLSNSLSEMLTRLHK